MNAPSTSLSSLTPQARQWLESWLLEFDQDWNQDHLAVQVRLLPPDSPLRRPALLEMVKIDLRRHWQKGHPILLEDYLSNYPELGTTATIPADLILTEYQVRRQSSRPMKVTEYAERFPEQFSDVLAMLTTTEPATIDQPAPVPDDSETDAPPATVDVAEVSTRVSVAPRPPAPHEDEEADAPLPPTVDVHEVGTRVSGAEKATPAAHKGLPEQFGRYRILKVLGKGAMGAVYLAHDSQLDRSVALKVPHLKPEDDPDMFSRFGREARAAAKLDHPNLCPVFDVGEVNGTHYLTMAFIEGQPLSEVLKRHKQLLQRAAAVLVHKLALALEEAHRHGVVHRDLKPANIMINQRREPVVMDFGLARRINDADVKVTRSGAIVGTPAYMAPEQVEARVKEIGPRSDIYALGVILYELLTGQLPFSGSMATIFAKIVTEQPKRPAVLRADVDAELERICLKAMAKRPEDRFGTMKEFADALSHYLRSAEAIKSTPNPPVHNQETVTGSAAVAPAGAKKTRPAPVSAADPAQRTAAKTQRTAAVVPPPAAQPPRRRGLWVAGIIAATLLASAGGYFAYYQWSQKKDGPGPVAATPGAQAAQPLESLTLKLDVGAGEDLQEPVALDLGLGFPLWLTPVGVKEKEKPAFGAIPYETTATAKVPAGSTATFSFSSEGKIGQDTLLWSKQLLGDVRVSDISRIGFASLGGSNWELAGYEILVNGQPFAANKKVGRKAGDAQQEARAQLAALGLKSGPLERERADLIDLANTKLANGEDRSRLAEVEKQLAALVPDKQRLDGQLSGRYPWHLDPVPPGVLAGRAAPIAVASAKVTVVTYSHDGADSRNYVYFRAGARKYLIGTPERPLSGFFGPQQFTVDLRACPLTRDDLRDWALGMVGNTLSQDQVPDRWHPQRLMVEIDGKVAYDSEAQEIDRRSLESIRLIPPRHYNTVGEVVKNKPIKRETSLWEAGKSAGLEEGSLVAATLPSSDARDYPRAEAGLDEAGTQPRPAPEGDPPPTEPPKGTNPAGPLDPPGAMDAPQGPPNFPGETPIPVSQTVTPNNPPPAPAPDSPIFVFTLQGLDPPPSGRPFQVEAVRITQGRQIGDNFTVEWTVLGDETQIDHYEVTLIQVRPETDTPFSNGVVFPMAMNLPPGIRSGTRPLNLVVNDPRLFLAPRVAAVPVDQNRWTPHVRIGPARPILPAGPIPLIGLIRWYGFWNAPNPAPALFPAMPPLAWPPNQVSPGGRPAGLGRAVWRTGQTATHTALLIDDNDLAWHIAARPGANEGIRFFMRTRDPLPDGLNTRIVAHLGFEGLAVNNSVNVRMTCLRYPTGGGPTAEVGTVDQTATTAEPLKVLDLAVPTGGPGRKLLIVFDVTNFTGDPAFQPTLFGVRLVPQ